MEQNFTTTKFPTAASQTTHTGGAAWSNPSNILLDDGSTANLGLAGSGSATLKGQTFGVSLPPGAVVDGISVFVDCTFQNGGWIDISLDLGLAGTTIKSAMTVNGTHGDATDLWGATSIDPADLANLEVSLFALGTVDDNINVDYLTVTVYWHIELNSTIEDVPTRIDYKVYSRDGRYLGLLPKVTSKLVFAQDINSAGSSIQIVCGKFVRNEVTASPLLTEAGDIITTEDDLPILATDTDLLVTTGNSIDETIFKNSNRIKVWVYNKYYPNGKLMFSGQVNRLDLKYGGSDAQVKLTVYSDGLDLNNYIARGYPFVYTEDNIQTTWNDVLTVTYYSTGGWEAYGQSFTTGPAVTNIGAILLALQGTADVTVSLYDAPNGNLLGSVTKAVSNGSILQTQFEFPALIPAAANTSYFFGISVKPGQQIKAQFTNVSAYAGGNMYNSLYSGGSGGGSWGALTYDLYFITKYGAPTTTVTYSTDDPVADMAHGILLDYNSRGGLITERDFDATGLSLTYTFVVSFIYDALKKILELCPTGYYSYIDLGTAEIDIKQMSTTADFTVVRGRHINELTLALTIEQVKNYLLLSGGEVTPGVNLYRDYVDNASMSNYGIRTSPKSDNRITLTATADAVGDSFIQENAEETQETTLIINNDKVDITQFVPGKTIGFKNFGNFIDDMVLQIVRREPNMSDGTATLTLGRLPIRMNDEIQRIQRDMLNQQTISNPTAPS